MAAQCSGGLALDRRGYRNTSSGRDPLGVSNFGADPAADLASWLAWDAAQIGARLIGLTFLLMAVWLVRTQVRLALARGAVVTGDAGPAGGRSIRRTAGRR